MMNSPVLGTESHGCVFQFSRWGIFAKRCMGSDPCHSSRFSFKHQVICVKQIGDRMSAEELSRTLTKLHSELADTPELDASTLRSLRVVLGDVQLALDRAALEADAKQRVDESGAASSEVGARSGTVSGQLQELIEAFEAKHPRLTLTLSQIADRLADMGI